jgi:cation diffusion facilitator family transporter
VDDRQQRTLIRFLLLSLAAAIATIVLKVTAAAVTGSVGLLSDALESGVNLVAVLVALWAVRLSARPPDPVHQFGHGKAEYLSAAVEGAMVLVAAGAIIWTSAHRLVEPTPLEQPGLGLALSMVASLINLGVGVALLRAGRRHRSLTLLADGKHLLTDVVTSAGVLVGIALVAIFGWDRLDPIVALLVGVNVLFTGYGLLRRSISGILDAALPAEDLAAIETIVARYREQGIDFHALRTREAGRQRFVYIHVLVPDHWTVKHSHDVAERFKADLGGVLPGVVTFAHVEPRDDPASYGHEHLHPVVPPRPAGAPHASELSPPQPPPA